MGGWPTDSLLYCPRAVGREFIKTPMAIQMQQLRDHDFNPNDSELSFLRTYSTDGTFLIWAFVPPSRLLGKLDGIKIWGQSPPSIDPCSAPQMSGGGDQMSGSEHSNGFKAEF